MSDDILKFRANVQKTGAPSGDLLHSPFYPADIYSGEALPAKIRFAKGKEFSLPLWRLSPLGMEVVVPPDQETLISESIVPGEVVTIDVRLGSQQCNVNGVLLSTVTRENNKLILGFRWCQSTDAASKEAAKPHNAAHERRRSQRWNCPEEFLPTGIAPNSVRFNDFIHFRVRDISRGGVRFLTSLRNRYLIPGMTLDTQISFPLFGLAKVKLKLVDLRTVTTGGKDYLSVGSQIVEEGKSFQAIVANYLMQFAQGASPSELKSGDINSKKASEKLEYIYVKTKEEYAEVLNLRFACYRAAGKVADGDGIDVMADNRDSRARIIAGRYQGKLVSTLRIIFPEPEDRLEIDDFVKFPPNSPRRDEMVEVTRFAIDPTFQGSDLVFGMMKHLFMVMAQVKRKWICTFATQESMEKFYTPFGAEPFGEKFRHPVLNNIEQQAFFFNVEKVLNGANVDPIRWNILVSDIYEYMHTSGYSEYDPLSGLRIWAYRLFRPIARVYEKRLYAPRKAA